MDWGIPAVTEDEIACWVEYFPGGAQYAGALLTLKALQAALVAGAAKRSGDQLLLSEAGREIEQFEKTPSRAVFVQSRFLIEAARRAGIPVHNVAGTTSGWQFGWGSRPTFFT